MNSSQLLEEVEEVFVVNLLEYVRALDLKYNSVFQPVEPGIYFLNRPSPILKPTKHYYSESGYKTQTPIKALDDIKEAILDEDGKVVIPAYIMQNQKKFLFTAPNIPVRALEVAKIVITEFMDSMLPYVDATDYRELAKPHLTTQGMAIYEQGYFEGICNRIINEVAMFMHVDIWNIYFLEIKNTDLIIKKSIDWRIYDWTRQQEEKAYEQKLLEETSQ